MTIEIKQLVIRAVVETRRDQAPASSAAVPHRTPVSERAGSSSPTPAIDRDALIAECTRQVLRELRKGRER